MTITLLNVIACSTFLSLCFIAIFSVYYQNKVKGHLKKFHNSSYIDMGFDDSHYDDSFKATRNFQKFISNKLYLNLFDMNLNKISKKYYFFSRLFFVFLSFFIISLLLIKEF